MIRIDVITVFPEMVEQALNHSILKRACDNGIADIRVVNLRDFATDRHRTTDDTPCGGGGGMLMKIEPIALALDSMCSVEPKTRVLLTDPQGRVFDQEFARELAREDHIVVLCGRYEGVDDRVREHLVDDCVSIGDYVVTGGELPALVMIDAIVRLQEGALGDADATSKDSFTELLLEYPQYTRPRSFRGWEVPDILFSGHFANIERWRRKQQLALTRVRRPDLWSRFKPDKNDLAIMREIEMEKPSVYTAESGPPDGTMSDIESEDVR